MGVKTDGLKRVRLLQPIYMGAASLPHPVGSELHVHPAHAAHLFADGVAEDPDPGTIALPPAGHLTES